MYRRIINNIPLLNDNWIIGVKSSYGSLNLLYIGEIKPMHVTRARAFLWMVSYPSLGENTDRIQHCLILVFLWEPVFLIWYISCNINVYLVQLGLIRCGEKLLDYNMCDKNTNEATVKQDANFKKWSPIIETLIYYERILKEVAKRIV